MKKISILSKYFLRKYAQVLPLGESSLSESEVKEEALKKARGYLSIIKSKNLSRAPVQESLFTSAESVLTSLINLKDVSQNSKQMAILDVRANYSDEIDPEEFVDVINRL